MTLRQPAPTVADATEASGALAKERAAPPRACAGSPCTPPTQAQRSVGQKPLRQLCEHHWSSTEVPATLEHTWPPAAAAAAAAGAGAVTVGVTGATAAAAHGRPGFWLSDAAAAPALSAAASRSAVAVASLFLATVAAAWACTMSAAAFSSLALATARSALASVSAALAAATLRSWARSAPSSRPFAPACSAAVL